MRRSKEDENVLVLYSNGCIMQKVCLLGVQHRTAFLLTTCAIMLTLRILKKKKRKTLTLTLLLFKIHVNQSSDREVSVLSDIIRSYFVHMQMKDFILYCMCRPLICKQELGHHELHEKTENLHKNLKERRRRRKHAMLFCQQDIFKVLFWRGEFFLLS